jgi:hypothetical protein
VRGRVPRTVLGGAGSGASHGTGWCGVGVPRTAPGPCGTVLSRSPGVPRPSRASPPGPTHPRDATQGAIRPPEPRTAQHLAAHVGVFTLPASSAQIGIAQPVRYLSPRPSGLGERRGPVGSGVQARRGAGEAFGGPGGFRGAVPGRSAGEAAPGRKSGEARGSLRGRGSGSGGGAGLKACAWGASAGPGAGLRWVQRRRLGGRRGGDSAGVRGEGLVDPRVQTWRGAGEAPRRVGSGFRWSAGGAALRARGSRPSAESARG